MKMKTQFAVAGMLLAGLLASGCSQQQVAQPAQQAAEEPAPAPAPAPVAPAPRPAPAPAPAPAPVMPKVKAKGNYKGPVEMDQGSKEVMQQYQK